MTKPNASFYVPKFSPWLGYGDFARYLSIAQQRTLVEPDRLHALYCLLRQAMTIPGEIWECGVYRGGTAAMFARILHDGGSSKVLRLFDTFGGMPEVCEKDLHRKGDFSDTSVEAVKEFVGPDPLVHYHVGFIPETFPPMGDAIAFAHIDVDIYQSVKDCCAHIYPHTTPGGFIVFDDYGFPTCPGAMEAVDEFFADKPEVPLVTPAGHAIVFKR